jgi:hypothetical protein
MAWICVSLQPLSEPSILDACAKLLHAIKWF